MNISSHLFLEWVNRKDSNPVSYLREVWETRRIKEYESMHLGIGREEKYHQEKKRHKKGASKALEQLIHPVIFFCPMAPQPAPLPATGILSSAFWQRFSQAWALILFPSDFPSPPLTADAAGLKPQNQDVQLGPPAIRVQSICLSAHLPFTKSPWTFPPTSDICRTGLSERKAFVASPS